MINETTKCNNEWNSQIKAGFLGLNTNLQD